MQFSIHRIWLLTRKQWAENRQLYILGLLAIAGIMAAIIVFDIFSRSGLDTSSQQLILYVGATATGAVFASTILSQFNEKIKGMQALTLPASALEKFFVALIYSLIVFPLVYLVMVYPLIVAGHYIDIRVKRSDVDYYVNNLYSLSGDRNTFELLVTFFIMQTIALLGSVLFRRYVFIKSLVLVIAVFFGVRIVNSLVTKSLIDTEASTGFDANVQEIYINEAGKVIHKNVAKEHLLRPTVDAVPYSDFTLGYWGNKKYFNGAAYAGYQLKIHQKYDMVFEVLLFLGIPFLWLITWFKLKEKQL